jgi:hydrogenase maturation factor HypF (carbamoyltransferase family)
VQFSSFTAPQLSRCSDCATEWREKCNTQVWVPFIACAA